MTNETNAPTVWYLRPDGTAVTCDACDAALTDRNSTPLSRACDLCTVCNNESCPHDDTENGHCLDCDRDDLAELEFERYEERRRSRYE